MRSTIIDAGPLIALFASDDHHHRDITAFLKGYIGELITTWPVITETTHLLSKNHKLQTAFLEWIRLGGLRVIDIKISSLDRIIELSKKYKDIPMDLADATLVVLAEENRISDIISIDSDYDIYRIFKKERFNNLYQKFLTSRKRG